jgi:hypothetical protein
VRVGGNALPRDALPLKEHSVEFRCKIAASGINIIERVTLVRVKEKLYRETDLY